MRDKKVDVEMTSDDGAAFSAMDGTTAGVTDNASAGMMDNASAGVADNAMADATAKIAELTNDLQRTRADFENFRKQIDLQKANEKKATKFATVAMILPLLDDLDLAIRNYAELKPLEKSLAKTLKDLGLMRIPSEAGVEFNPDLHDAVMVLDGDGEREVVAETLRPGYYYEKEVLRPAMVKVKRG